MYAIVDIAGQQFKVEKEQKLFVHRLEGDAGSKVSFDKVLLIENDGKITFGNPVIRDAAVSAKVIEHVKGDKVLVFKKKRRKGYKKLNGHRQYMTRIEITGIEEKAAKQPAAKAAEKKTTATTAADNQPEAKAATTKTSAAKTDTAKQPAEKKTTAGKSSATKKPAASKTATKASAEKKPAGEKKTTAAKKPAAKKPAAKKPAAKKSSDGDKAADQK